MSVKVMSEIWQSSKLSGTPLLVVLALGDYANDERVCWPSMATIAHKSRISERQAQRLIKALTEQGHIILDMNAGPRGTNLYHIPNVQEMECLEPYKPDKAFVWGDTNGAGDTVGGVTLISQGGDTNVAKEVTIVSPKPSLNHHESSSVNSNELTSSDDVVEQIPFDDELTAKDQEPVQLEKKSRKKRTITQWENDRHVLGDHFTSLSSIRTNGRTQAELQKRWWGPLKVLYEAADKDIDRTCNLITLAIIHNRERKLTIASPQSIVETGVAIAGEMNPNVQPELEPGEVRMENWS